MTDGDFILARWRSLGYHATAEDTQHEDFGAYFVRRRAYLIGLLHLVGPEAAITHYVHSLFTAVQGKMCLNVKDFIDVCPVKRRANLNR